MIRALTVALAVGLCSSASASDRLQDVSCDDTDRMTQSLKLSMGVERQGFGLRDPETLLEVWVNPRSGSWLILQNYTNGTSCIIAMGAHWEGPLPGPA